MRRTLIILGICTALGACSSSDGSKSLSGSPTGASTKPPATSPVGDTTAAGPQATDSAATAQTTKAVAPGRTVDPCSIATTDDVAAAFGGTVAAGVVNPDNGGCDYEITGQTKTGDSGILTQVSIEFEDYESFDNTKVVLPEIEKIDGLGNEAWYYSFGSQLHIDLGGQGMVISGAIHGDPAVVKAEVVAFAQTVTGKL